MADTDRVLIDPSPQALESALAEAACQANGRARLRLLEWPPADLDVFRMMARTPEGRHQWNGGPQRGKSGEPRTIVAVAWWTDWVGRRHVRVVGRRGNFNNPARNNLLCPGASRPFQWLTYPENLYFRHTPEKTILWGLCRCGAVGPPQSLGWMGNVCGPCHDRIEAGERPAFPGPACTILGGRQTAPAQGHFSPDGRTVLAHGRLTNEVTAWNLESGLCRTRAVSGEWVQALALLSDRTVACVLWDGRVLFWNFITGEEGLLLNLGCSPHGAALSPDGTRLIMVSLVAVNSLEVRAWDMKSGHLLWAVPIPWEPAPLAHAARVAVEFAPDGRTFVCEVEGPALAVLDAATGDSVRPNLPLWGRRLREAAISPDGSLLAAVCVGPYYPEGNIGLWQLPSWDAAEPPSKRDFSSVTFSPDGRLLAPISGGDVTLWEVAGMRRLADFSWHGSRINSIAFSPDGCWLATAAEDDLVKPSPRVTLTLLPASEGRSTR